MFDLLHTSDNIHLSKPLLAQQRGGQPPTDPGCEIARPRLEQLIAASVSENTKRAYMADLSHFVASGGSLPATPDMVALYISRFSQELAVSTLSRRIATLSKIHTANGWPNPCQSEILRSAMQGLKRLEGSAQKQVRPLCREELFLVLDDISETRRDTRDKALLLTGFAGGFRRSELVGLNWEDIAEVREGVVITLRFSKTDQTGVGRKVGIPLGRSRHCPVKALLAWREHAGGDGPVFRPVDWLDRVQSTRLSSEAVPIIIRERLEAVGIDSAGYSGHSLRAGFATSAARAGIPSYKIRQQTGHKFDAMLARYIRDGELFTGNAAAVLL